MAAEGAKQIKEVKGLLYTADYEFRPGRIRIEGDRIAEVDFCTRGELSEAERDAGAARTGRYPFSRSSGI